MQKFLGLALGLALAAPVQADEISDALTAAQDAYAAQDLKTASAQIAAAQAALQARQSDMLGALLPEAPAGFSREINAEFAAGFAMFGGGSGAEARYISDKGAFTLDFMADNSMVAGMAEMFVNPEMLAMMGNVVKVGDVSILDQGESVTALVAGRVLVTAQGMTAPDMLPIVQSIDFDRLAAFDK